MNKLTVVGQTPFGGTGPDPQQTPTPLDGVAKPGPLQVYETHRPFFGSTPAGGLDIVTSKSSSIFLLGLRGNITVVYLAKRSQFQCLWLSIMLYMLVRCEQTVLLHLVLS